MIEAWTDLNHLFRDAALQLALSTVCGIALGFERERKDKPAGLRTILLITVGSTLYMILSRLIAYVPTWPEATTSVDPSRIASQVVTGIGFLGAGSIIRAHGEIQGLTTAAVIWLAAGIGLAIGMGFVLPAAALTVVIILLLILLDPVGMWLAGKGEKVKLELRVPDDTLTLRQVEELLHSHGVQRKEISVEPYEGDEVMVIVKYSKSSSDTTFLMLNALKRLDGVRGVSTRRN